MPLGRSHMPEVKLQHERVVDACVSKEHVGSGVNLVEKTFIERVVFGGRIV